MDSVFLHNNFTAASFDENDVRSAIYVPPLTEADKALPLCLATIGIARPERHVIRDANFHIAQLLFCAEGTGTLSLSGTEYEICAGMGFVLPAFQPHRYAPRGDCFTTYFIGFDGTAKNTILPRNGSVFQVRDMQLLTEYFYRLARIAPSERDCIASSVLLYELLLTLPTLITFSDGGQAIDGSAARDRLSLAVQYISQHILDPFRLQDLAAAVCVTPTHLCRLFQQGYRMRPSEYVNSAKIQYAKQLLTIDRSLKIEFLASHLGFSNSSYFDRQFKKYTGKTPRDFKKDLH